MPATQAASSPSTNSSHLKEKDGTTSYSTSAVALPALPGGGYSTVPLWKTFAMMTGLTLQFICKSSSVQSMNVAVGFIAQSLNFTTQETSWIQSAYALGSGCLLMLFVPLSDKFGARSVFLCSCLMFIAGAIGCSASQTATQFLAFRSLQGIGASGTVPSALQIIHQVFPVVHGRTARDMAFAVFTTGSPLGSALGTIFGGLPTEYSAIKWRGIYVVLACLSATSALCVLFTAPPSITKPVPGGIDYLGGCLVSVALTLTLFCISQGSNVGWRTPYVLVLLVVGLVFFPIFAGWELYLESKGHTPMICMSNFKRGRYAVVSLLSLIGFGSFIAWDNLTGLFWQRAMHYSALQVMLRFLPQSIFGLIGGPLGAYALRKISTQIVFISGCVMILGANIIFALAGTEDTYWNGAQFLGPTIGMVGACWVYVSSMLYLVSCVPPNQASASGAWFSVVTAYASSLGIIVVFAVIEDYPVSKPNVYTNGYWTGAAWSAFAGLAAIPAFWGIGIIGKSGETLKVRKEAEQNGEDEHIAV
ncbi:MFS general substrate transporter [Hymenopellis radicata]|nr:MFS general substrate transporter [Hymenopellis radicata]